MYDDITLAEKLNCLKKIIGQYQRILVAFSGGVDSTLLLTVCNQVLPGRVTAVTVKTIADREKEIRQAAELAQSLGVRHYTLDATEISRPIFAENPVNRCYFCKRLIFERLQAEARSQDIDAVVDGSHLDDREEERPGIRALRELGIVTPFKQAGLDKNDIRLISKQLGLPTHDKPAQPCLATRFLPGERIDESKLSMVELAEDYLARQGLVNHRVRYRNGEARIETNSEGMAKLLDINTIDALREALLALGFSGICLDLNARQG